MIFDKIKIQNFMSLRSVSLKLDNRGLVLIQGKNQDNENFDSNGAGKTNLIEAILWVLYGKTMKGVKSDDVVHRKPKKNCYVFLDIIDDDGSSYRIARYRKHQEHSNNVYVFKDGNNITPKSEKDTTEFIVSLLQMDYMTFTSSILYSVKSFKFTSATDSEMKKAFDTMLDFDVLNRCLEVAKTKNIEYETSKRMIQSKIESVDMSLETCNSQLESLVQQEKDNKVKIQEKIEHYNNILEKQTEEYDNFLSTQKDNSQELEELEKLMKKTKEKLESFNEITEQVSALYSVQKSNSHEITTYEKLKTRTANKIQEYKKKLQDTTDKVGSTCPVCGATLTEDSIADAAKEIQSEIESLQGDIQEHQSEITKLEQSTEDIQGLIRKCEKLLEEKVEYQENFDRLQRQISDIQAQSRLFNKSKKQYEQGIEQTSNVIDSLERDSEKTFGNLINSCKAQITQLQESQQDYQLQIEDINTQLSHYNYWIEAFGNQGIKSYLLDSVTPYLNQRVSHYIQRLASDSIDIQFSTQTKLKNGQVRDKFNIAITNKFGGSKYGANSGGEQKRIDIAVNMALQDLVASRSTKKLNMVWYDEAFDALDDSGCEKVIELLQENADNKSSIFVTTHNPALKAYFDNYITVTKKDGYSRVEE